MKTSWTRAGASLVSYLVVLSLSFSGPFAYAFSYTAWPSTTCADPFHLTHQRWDLGTRNSLTARLYQIFGLSSMMDPVPVDKAPTFDKFLVELEDGHLVIREAEVARRGGDDEAIDAADLRLKVNGASHHFDSIKPLRYSVDKDLLIVLDTEGVVHAIDMHLVKTVAYRAPVPVFKLHKLENVAEFGDTLDARFVNEREWRELNAKPRANGLYPLDRPANHRWHTGDWALMRSTPEKSEVVMELDRSVIYAQISAFETILAYWSDLIHPQAPSRTRVEVNAEIPYQAALAMRRLDKRTVAQLVPNAKGWAEAAKAPRDQFKMLGENKFGIPTPTQINRRITPVAMLAVAAVIAGGAVLDEGMRRFGFDYSFARSVQVVMDHLWFLVPAVLVDSAYRHTLLKSAFWLAMAAPAIYATASLFGRLTGRKEDPRVTWVRAGMRLFAKVNRPFWHPMAHLLGQPHVIKALSLGVNPGRLVQPESRLGKDAGLTEPTRMGLVSPLKLGIGRRATVAQTGRLLRAYEDQAHDRIALARWLALTVVSQESNVDPATIALAEETSEAPVPRTDAQQNQRRRELAVQIARNLSEREVDPRELTKADLEHELERARFAVRSLANRRVSDTYLDRARYEWNRLSTGTLRGLYDFARSDNEFWETAEPTKSISARAWGIFVSDYYLGTTFAMTEGPRANLLDPASLVAREGVFLNTSPGGRYDILDTPRWYSINHNAKFTAVYMREQKLTTDPAYQPRENTHLQIQFRAPRPWEAFLDFANDFRNPSTGEYGEILLKQLQVAFAMIQTSYILTTSARVFFAGSSFETSSLSFVYHFLWGHIQAGTFFDFINSTIDRMKKKYASNRDRTQMAVNAIHQGLRLDDPALYREGVGSLLKLYEGREKRFSPQLQRQLADTRKIDPELVQFEQARDLMFAAVAKPPLPGKEPKWLEVGAYVLAVGVSTYLGLKMSVPTFGPNVDWNYLIGSSALWATAIYTGIYVATKAWRAHQRAQGSAACESELTPHMPISPVREHAS